MHAALRAHFGDAATWQTPAGGLFFWLRLRDPVDTRPLLDRALARGVAFMPGEVFFPDEEAPLGYLRLNFSHATAAEMDRGLAVLADEIGRTRRGARAVPTADRRQPA